MEKIDSQKGKIMILVDGYRYRKDKAMLMEVRHGDAARKMVAVEG